MTGPGWHRRSPLCAVHVRDPASSWRRRGMRCAEPVAAYDRSDLTGACARHLEQALADDPARRWVWAHDPARAVDPATIDAELVMAALAG